MAGVLALALGERAAVGDDELEVAHAPACRGRGSRPRSARRRRACARPCCACVAACRSRPCRPPSTAPSARARRARSRRAARPGAPAGTAPEPAPPSRCPAPTRRDTARNEAGPRCRPHATTSRPASARPHRRSAARAQLAAEPGVHSDNMSYVKNIPYPAKNGGTPNFGTDIEFATLAAASTPSRARYENGMQIVDITDPQQARTVAHLRLRRHAGRRPDLPPGLRARPHVRRLRLGRPAATAPRRATARRRRSASTAQARRHGQEGTFIVEITNPLRARRRVSFVGVEQGTHNHTIHPSGNYLYNSNSELDHARSQPAIEIYDISNFARPSKVGAARAADPPGPRHRVARHHVQRGRHAAPTRPRSRTGVIIDTTDPARPTIVSS